MYKKSNYLLISLLCGIFLFNVALAATLVGTGSGGAPVTLEDVDVVGLSRDSQGTLLIGFYNYNSGSGDLQTVSMSSITAVEFFKEGGTDRIPTYDLTLQNGAQQEVFKGVTLYEFKLAQGIPGGGVIASEAEKEEDRFFIPASSIVTALKGEDRLAGKAGKAAANLEKMMSGQELSDDEREEIADAWTDESEDDAPLDRMENKYVTIIDIIQYLFTVISWVTAIWLMVYAFSTEDSKSGYLIILGQTCCCFFWFYKIMYAFKYKGSARGLLMGLVVLELLCLVAIFVVILVFGVAAVSMLSSITNR